MALSSDESRRLTELADQLNAQDPTLARLLTGSGGPVATRGRHRVFFFGLVTLLALLVIVVGVATSVPLVVGGGVAVFVFDLVALTAGWWATQAR